MKTDKQSPVTPSSLSATPPGRLRAKTMRLLLAVGILSVIGFTIWPGCASVPLGSKKTPISKLQQSDFTFIKANSLPRTEVLAKVGEPDEYFADLRVSAYKLNQLTRRRLWLLFGILPFPGPEMVDDGTEIALIGFDETDHARQVKIVRAYYPQTARMAAEKLAGKSAKR